MICFYYNHASSKGDACQTDELVLIYIVDYVLQSWRLWVEKRHLQLIDDSLGNTADAAELLRCIHISLLCVQNSPEDRPDMLSVVVMLTSDSNLPKPKQPAFYVERNLHHEDLSAINQKSCSENEVTISSLDAR